MPSYGSNDGYGRQKLKDRPSTRLTDIGARQADSSAMAALLAEKDIRPTDDGAQGPAVDPDAPPDVQWFQAAKVGDAAHLKQLLNERPSLLGKAARAGGRTALHHCAAAGHLTCANELMDRGLMVNVRDAQQSTPLHSAAGSGQLQLVVELMRRGADVGAQDLSGMTAAELAEAHGHTQVVEALRGAGDLSPKGTGAP
eukprot:CAMPEP_0119059994 /NCGR_PEP_ID=MMETSP1178-20130426/4011_1 /TAXON_ID=33656 /ORGANISM="unid sp, Strain CCMP2000" /LENGTH=197 /DNA_ID=CAMNT_0007041059 /DNA_START=94 /DNA_END=687 /DNA_ORIENTATION=+